MSWCPAIKLAKTLEVVDGNGRTIEHLVVRTYGLHFGEVQHRVQQRRRVSVRENEAISIRPHRIRGIVTQKLLPQNISHRRKCNGSAGMPGVGLLYRIDRKRADGINAEGV